MNDPGPVAYRWKVSPHDEPPFELSTWPLCTLIDVQADNPGAQVEAVPAFVTASVTEKAKHHKDVTAVTGTAVTSVTSVTAKNNNEWMRRKVITDLRTHPEITYAAEVDASGDPVIIMLGIRDVGTCVLTIDAKRWNLESFIALLDRQAGLRQEVAA